LPAPGIAELIKAEKGPAGRQGNYVLDMPPEQLLDTFARQMFAMFTNSECSYKSEH